MTEYRVERALTSNAGVWIGLYITENKKEAERMRRYYQKEEPEVDFRIRIQKRLRA